MPEDPLPDHEVPDDPLPDHSLAPRKPRTVGGAAFLAVLAGTLIGLAVVALGGWRPGLLIIGGSLLAGAATRLVVRNEQSGMLGLRRKLIDVATLLLLGGGIVALALLIADQPAR